MVPGVKRLDFTSCLPHDSRTALSLINTEQSFCPGLWCVNTGVTVCVCVNTESFIFIIYEDPVCVVTLGNTFYISRLTNSSVRLSAVLRL